MPGSLREIRPSVWKLTVYSHTDSLGKRHQRTATFEAKGKRAAERAAAEHTARILAGARTVKDQRGTVRELVDLWVKHRAAKDSPATIYRRRSIVNTIRTDLGRIPLADLTSLHIDQWYDKLRTDNIGQGSNVKQRSESTVHHYGRVLAAILFQGWKWGKIETLPARRAEKPKRRQHAKVKAPPVATIGLLIAAAPPDLAVAARVLAATGLRRGELCALRWTDVDLDEGILRITKSIVYIPQHGLTVKAPKNEESVRIVEIDPTTVYILDRHHRRWQTERPELVADAYLFPDPFAHDRTGHTPRSPDWLSRGWRRLCATHGATIRLHDLRHYHASTLIDQHVPVTAVSARLGHAKTSTTTDIYGAPVDGSGRAASLQIERALRDT